jgi:glycosyltransferase involved in cell wall biosynthesis
MPDSSLRIAIVSTQRKWYGGEEEIYLLAQGLRRRNHQVHILARRGGALAERMKAEGFGVGEFAGNGRNPLALWQIRRQLRRIRPDVLQYNDSHALTAAGLASWGLNIPLRIAMRHVSLPIRSPWRFRRLSDCVVCVSHAVADVCRDAGLAADTLRVVFAVTDPEKIRAGDRRRGRLAVGVADDQPMILVVASLNEHKGHAFLLEALPEVFKHFPTALVVLAGDGPRNEPLQLQTTRLGIEGRVRFLGYRRDVPDLIRAADLLVLPSFAGEGLPVTLMDAMFAGVPIVTTAVGGVADLTGSDEPGCEPVAWVVPLRDSGALGRALLESLGNAEQRALRADRARQRAERLFTPDRMVDAMLAVYQEMIGRG